MDFHCAADDQMGQVIIFYCDVFWAVQFCQSWKILFILSKVFFYTILKWSIMAQRRHREKLRGVVRPSPVGEAMVKEV